MTKKEVQNIINEAYPKIKTHYGLSKYDNYNESPEIKLHHNIYARLTGIDEMTGECSPAADYERHSNIIWIYWPESVDEEWVIGTILHEYRHYLQDGEEFQRLYDEGYEYDTHPFEIEATKEEENWHLFAK